MRIKCSISSNGQTKLIWHMPSVRHAIGTCIQICINKIFRNFHSLSSAFHEMAVNPKYDVVKEKNRNGRKWVATLNNGLLNVLLRFYRTWYAKSGINQWKCVTYVAYELNIIIKWRASIRCSNKKKHDHKHHYTSTISCMHKYAYNENNILTLPSIKFKNG